MKSNNQVLFSLIASLFLQLPAHAGTVITTNLPPDTAIVNINGQADGTGTYSNDPYQSFWYRPTATAPSLTLAAGTYFFRVINPRDAAAFYPNLTSTQLAQIYTAWTYNSPWTETFLVFNSTALGNPNETQLFDAAIAPGLPGQQTFPSPTAAYHGTLASGYYYKLRPAPPGRAGDASSFVTQWTFTTQTTILFVVPDNGLGDNSGGVSVVVTAAAPLALANAVSRKNHGSIGAFDINLPLSGTVGVECRNGTGTGGDHKLVISFTNSVVSGDAVVTTGTGGVAGTPTFSGNNMTVNLTGVTNAQTVTVTLSNVMSSSGETLPTTPLNVSFLIGDTNGDRLVNSGDALQTRSRSGQLTDDTNFRSDVNLDGLINSGDTTTVRLRSGTFVP